MDTQDNGIEITTYDRLLRAWENSMELVRDYQMYSKSVDNKNVQEMFKKYAEDEGMRASEIRKVLVDYKN